MEKEIETTTAKDFETWLAWLNQNHDTKERIWLTIAKKSSKLISISMDEAIAGALCYGWIDSRKKGLDHLRYMVYFTPRRQKSKWSLANKKMVEKLIRDGFMHQAGITKIEQAKKLNLY